MLKCIIVVLNARASTDRDYARSVEQIVIELLKYNTFGTCPQDVRIAET